MSKCCIKSTAVEATTTALTITIPDMTFQDGCTYKILVCQDVPCSALGLPVIISSTADIPVWVCGDARSFRGCQLKQLEINTGTCVSGFCIPVEYVNEGITTDPEHFSVIRRLKSACL